MKFIFLMGSLQLLSSILLLATTTRADFTFALRVNSISTSGNCFGDDLSLGCETYLSIFCLRGHRQTSSTDTSDCPFGFNDDQIGPDEDSGFREISSRLPWQGRFQLFIQAFDDDNGFSNPDHLDNIIINRNLEINGGESSLQMYSGSRVSIAMTFRVHCDDDFYGRDCSTFCIDQDNDVDGHFTCNQAGSRICLPNYYGSRCLTFCLASSHEVNGFYTCDPNDGSRICREGFTDPETFCTENIDDCVVGPCQNGGNCTDLVADFECLCPPGYTGKTCSVDINECLEADCPGNSTCIEDTVNSFVCECNAGFEGQNCTEIQPCDSVVCENGGTCVSEDPFSFECVCAAGYNGTTCELDIDECLGAVCPEGSLCTDEVDGYVCSSITTPPLSLDDPFSSKRLTNKEILIIGCIAGSVVIIIMLILIIIISTVLGRKKMERYKAERSLSHIYHPAPKKDITLTKAIITGIASSNPLEDTSSMDFNVLYNGHVHIDSPPVRTQENESSAENGNADVIYEQVLSRSQSHGVKLTPAASEPGDGDMELCSNVAYGTLGHQAINNPLYITTPTSREPPIYSVPRPACPPAKTEDSNIKNEYAALTDGSSCNTDSQHSVPGPSLVHSGQAKPAYYESIELLAKDPPVQQAEAAVAPKLPPRDTELDCEKGAPLHYDIPTSTRSACKTGDREEAVGAVRYSKLQHSDVAEKTLRLATIPDSGYETLETES